MALVGRVCCSIIESIRLQGISLLDANISVQQFGTLPPHATNFFNLIQNVFKRTFLSAISLVSNSLVLV